MARLGEWSFWLVLFVAIAAIISFSSRLFIVVRLQGVNSLRRWLGSPFDSHVSESEDSVLKQQVDVLLNERRARCSRALVLIYLGIMCFYWTKLPVNFIIYPEVHLGNVTEQPGWETELLMAFFTMINIIAASFPRIVDTSRGRQAVYFSTMLYLCATVFMPVSVNEVDRRTLSATVGALTSGLLDLRMRTIIVPLFCLLGCLISAAIRDYDRVDLQIQAAYLYVGAISIVLLTLYLAEALMVTWIHREVGTLAGQIQNSAVSSLLDMMCDCVVDLDEHACFKEHNAKLAVMLMHGEGRSLKGEELSLFMGDDSSRMRTEVVLGQQERASSTDRQSIPKASMVSARMRDSIGNRIRVVLYHVPYATFFGRINHIIGIREDTEFSVEGVGQHGGERVSVAPSGPAGELRPELALRLQQAAAGPGRQQAPHSSGSSSRSSRSSVNARGEQPSSTRSLEVYLLEGLPIRWSAEELQQELGLEKSPEGGTCPLLGQQLADGGSALLKQLQDMADSAADSSTEANFVRRLGQWEFKASLRVGDVGSSIPSDTAVAHPAGELTTRWRSLWVNFFVPIKTNEDGLPYIGLAVGRDLGAADAHVSRRRSGSSHRGTAASSTPQALSVVCKSSNPATMVAL